MPTESSSQLSSIYTPVDIESIKQKLANLTSANKQQSLKLKLSPGETVVRIVPYRHAKTPFNDLLFHYEIGNKKSVICAENFGKSCPICEFAEELRKNKKTKEDFIAFKKMASKTRCLLPVLVRGKEDEGVKFLSLNKDCEEVLLRLYNNPEYGDIVHPTQGVDIVVTYTSPTKELIYGKVTVAPKRNSTPLHNNKDMMIKIMKECPNVFEMYPELSREELKRILDKALNPSEENKETNASVGQVIGTEVVEEQESPTRDLDAELDEILGKK